MTASPDPKERERHRLLTRALWEAVKDDVLPEGTQTPITAVFFAPTGAAAEILRSLFDSADGWLVEVPPTTDNSDTTMVTIRTAEIVPSLDRLLELTDRMLSAATRAGATFDGL